MIVDRKELPKFEKSEHYKVECNERISGVCSVEFFQPHYLLVSDKDGVIRVTDLKERKMKFRFVVSRGMMVFVTKHSESSIFCYSSRGMISVFSIDFDKGEFTRNFRFSMQRGILRVTKLNQDDFIIAVIGDFLSVMNVESREIMNLDWKEGGDNSHSGLLSSKRYQDCFYISSCSRNKFGMTKGKIELMNYKKNCIEKSLSSKFTPTLFTKIESFINSNLDEILVCYSNSKYFHIFNICQGKEILRTAMMVKVFRMFRPSRISDIHLVKRKTRNFLFCHKHTGYMNILEISDDGTIIEKVYGEYRHRYSYSMSGDESTPLVVTRLGKDQISIVTVGKEKGEIVATTYKSPIFGFDGVDVDLGERTNYVRDHYNRFVIRFTFGVKGEEEWRVPKVFFLW